MSDSDADSGDSAESDTVRPRQVLLASIVRRARRACHHGSIQRSVRLSVVLLLNSCLILSWVASDTPSAVVRSRLQTPKAAATPVQFRRVRDSCCNKRIATSTAPYSTAACQHSWRSREQRMRKTAGMTYCRVCNNTHKCIDGADAYLCVRIARVRKARFLASSCLTK